MRAIPLQKQMYYMIHSKKIAKENFEFVHLPFQLFKFYTKSLLRFTSGSIIIHFCPGKRPSFYNIAIVTLFELL